MTDRFFTNALTLAGSLIGTEQIPLDIPAGGSEFTTPAQLTTYVEAALLALRTATCQYSAASNTAGFTATGAQIGLAVNAVSNAQMVVLDLTGTLAGAANLQLPTVSALQTVLVNSYDGQSYLLRIINNSSAAFVWTITTNTGWTLNGTITVAQNTFRDFLLTISSAASHTATLQNIGSGNN